MKKILSQCNRCSSCGESDGCYIYHGSDLCSDCYATKGLRSLISRAPSEKL